MTKTQKREFSKLSVVIKKTMTDVAYSNYFRQKDNLELTIDNDIDVAFFTIGNCFEDFDTIGDTVTRRCAKTEIVEVLESLKTENDITDVHTFISSNITAESVLEDILDMIDD